jgi:hypothetical protein
MSVSVDIVRIEQAINLTQELTLKDVLHRQLRHKDLGWVDMNMDEHVRYLCMSLAIDALGLKKRDKAFDALFNIYKAGIDVLWIDRVQFTMRDGVVGCWYCAGQDGASEKARIRKAIYAEA